jgi:hypothetical protein
MTIAAEASRYLEAVDVFTAQSCDPHADARIRALKARMRERLPEYARDVLSAAETFGAAVSDLADGFEPPMR